MSFSFVLLCRDKKTSILFGEYLLFGLINKGKFREYAFVLIPCIVLQQAIDLNCYPLTRPS